MVAIHTPGDSQPWHAWIRDALAGEPGVRILDASAAADESWEFRIGRRDAEPLLLDEIASGSDDFGVTLRSRESGALLQAGRFKIHYTYRRSLDGAMREASRWPAKAVRLITAGMQPAAAFDPFTADAPAAERRPSRVRFGYRLAANFLRTAFEFGLIEARWNIGLAEEPLRPGAPLPAIRWLQTARDYFVADPMLFENGERAEIFCELFPYRARKGSIAAISLEEPEAPPRIVMSGERHLSYPFVLRHDGVVYCVPEDHGADEVALFREVAYPNEWERAGTLVRGVRALDPTLFYDGTRWWLFCTRSDRDANLNLFAWFAERLEGPWIEHPANPIKTDISGARPAGNLFWADGVLYRPSQDCSRRYGGALSVQRILELSPSRFREERAFRLEPLPPYYDGLHTLTTGERRFAIDGLRNRLDPSKPWRLLTAWRSRARGRRQRW